MRLPSDILINKNKTAIYPRYGVDLAYWKKYYTFGQPFSVFVIDWFEGTRVTSNAISYSGADYTEYSDLGLHLFNDSNEDLGLITDLTADEIQVTGTIDENTDYYTIAKVYENKLTENPLITHSSEPISDIARVSDLDVRIQNPGGNGYVSGVGDNVSGNPYAIEVYSGGICDAQYIGRMLHINDSESATPAGFVMEAIITGIDTTQNHVYIDRPLPSGTVGNFAISVIIPEYEVDIFQTLPEIKGTDVKVFLFMGERDTELFWLSNGVQEYTGRVNSVVSISNAEILIGVYGRNKLKDKVTLGNVIKDGNANEYLNGSVIHNVGVMKPVIIGVHTYSQLTGYEPTGAYNNLPRCIYLGVDAVTGKRRYYISAHALASLRDIYVKNDGGRLNKISSADWTTVSVSGDDVIIEINNTLEATDYWFGNESYSDTDAFPGSSPDSAGQYLDRSANRNDADNSELLVKSQYTDPEERTPYYEYKSQFNEWDLTEIQDSDITQINVYALFKWDVENYAMPGYCEFNSTQFTSGDGVKRHESVGTMTASQAGVASGVLVKLANFSDTSTSEQYTSTLDTFLIYKKITYNKELKSDDVPELYADCDGLAFGSWINNRSAGDTNPAGGKYLYTHYSSGSSGSAIWEAVSLIEAILRDTVWGYSLTDDDLELDTFNRASDVIGTVVAPIYSDVEKGKQIIREICEENGLVFYQTNEGKIALWAYDTSAPFTYNDLSVNGDDFLELDTNCVWGPGKTIKTRVKITGNLSVVKSLFGFGGTYAYARIESDLIRIETDTNADTAILSCDFHTGLWYDIELRWEGNTISLYVNGELKDSDTVSDTSLTFDNILRGYSTSDFVGKMNYFVMKDAEGKDALNVQAINGIIRDVSGSYEITEYGSVLKVLGGNGILDFHAFKTGPAYVNIPIMRNSFTLNDDPEEFFTKIVYDYFFSQFAGRYINDGSAGSGDIEKTMRFNTVISSHSQITDALLGAYGENVPEVIIQTNPAGVGLNLFDVLNVRHPVLYSKYGASDAITTKWIVINIAKGDVNLAIDITLRLLT